MNRAHRAVGTLYGAIPAQRPLDPGIGPPQSLEEENPPQGDPKRTRHPETSSAYGRTIDIYCKHNGIIHRQKFTCSVKIEHCQKQKLLYQDSPEQQQQQEDGQFQFVEL